MSTIEIVRNTEESRSLDNEARSLIALVLAAGKCWPRLGWICFVVERDKHYTELGFKSFGAWMMDLQTTCDYKRTSLYLFKKLVEELFHDVSVEELEQADLGTAHILRKLSSEDRRDPRTKAALGKKPKEFLEFVAAHIPQSHIELEAEKKFHFPISSWDETIYPEILQTRVENNAPEMTYEEVFECWAVERRMARQMTEAR